MATGPSRSAVSTSAQAEWERVALWVQHPSAAQHLWERVLTEPERRRLGGDSGALYSRHGTVGMWMQLRGVSAERAVIDVGHQLGFLDVQNYWWLLRELGQEQDEAEEALRRAIRSRDLVLVERPRSAYWQGQPIDVDWERRPKLWEFFWEMCRSAKVGRSVDHLTFGDSVHLDFVAKQKSRLLGLPGFPVDLGDLIQPVGRRTQKLDLAPERIRLFELVHTETLRERTA